VSNISTELKQKLASIKLIVLDVDGVFTDGSIILSGTHSDTKEFHVQDGFGITMARHVGIQFGILTGRTSDAVKRRVEELNIDYYENGHFYKSSALREMIKTAGLTSEQVLYMGDDVLDLVCKPCVKLFVAPANAVARVRQEADWVTTRKGGDAAVREMLDSLLDARDLLTSTENYFIGENK